MINNDIRSSSGDHYTQVLTILIENFQEPLSLNSLITKYPHKDYDDLLFLFVLKGVGFLNFVNDSTVQFVGRNTSIIKFLQFCNQQKDQHLEEGREIGPPSKQKKSSTQTEYPLCFKVTQKPHFPSTLVDIKGQQVDLSRYHMVSTFVEKVVFGILFDLNKILNKQHLNDLIDQYSKDQDQQIFRDSLQILKDIQFLNYSESSPMVTWQGPDFINCLGLCQEDIGYVLGLGNSFEEYLYYYLKNFENELFNRELLYYRQLFINDMQDHQFDTTFLKFMDRQKSILQDKKFKSLLSNFRIGYAMLKGQKKNIMLKKLQNIIGRKNKHGNSSVKWQVDVDLGANRKVSKQHALILFNFKTKNFDIKCLSQKYPIKVNNSDLTHNDPPIELLNGTLLTIGDQNFYFLLPKSH